MRLRFATDVEPADAERVIAEATAAVDALAAAARAELLDALRSGTPLEAFAAARRILTRHKPQLIQALTDAHLAAALAGMRRVADRLPESPPAPAGPGSVAPAPYEPAPPSPLPPWQTSTLAATLRALPEGLQSAYLDALLPGVAAELGGAIGLPPEGPPWALALPGFTPPETHLPLIEEAVADLRRRRLLTRDDYDRLSADARKEAFTVAGVEDMAALGKIQDALTESVRTGGDLRDFRRQVEEDLDEGTFLSRRHMETVFRTAVQSSYSAGMDRMLAHDLVADAFPYEETLPIHDSRLTELCAVISRSGIQGTGIFRRDDPVWQKYKPPRHWNCRCGRNPLTIEMAAAKGIREAQEWLKTGRPPESPARVPWPKVELPKGWG